MNVPLINTLFLSGLAFIESVQVFAAAVWIGHFFGSKPALAAQTFPEDIARIGNTQAAWWTLTFAAICLAGQAIAIGLGRSRLQDAGFFRRWRAFAIAETILTFLLLTALFKIIVYDNRPQLATGALYAVLGLAVA
jgi:hypothetical protein